jgi:hypothetical protein|uniref:Uncharacterized protein n=1 Tax=Sipha flava TaxID=143950 RepID=A0A2S2QJY9_9HEMI
MTDFKSIREKYLKDEEKKIKSMQKNYFGKNHPKSIVKLRPQNYVVELPQSAMPGLNDDIDVKRANIRQKKIDLEKARIVKNYWLSKNTEDQLIPSEQTALSIMYPIPVEDKNQLYIGKVVVT